MVDLAKRRRVMERSLKLGHCICDARQACPCPVFIEKNVCLCAGERPETPPAGEIRLTRLVEKAGCASKIDQAYLKRVLHGLPAPADPRVLVGMAAGDDAGVYDLGNGTALVQTVDVFSPVVDEPCLFGSIAAANSLSDIYAMGGRPITALSVIGFPAATLPETIMRDILRGGLDKMAEAGVSVIGGHSINDPEIKAGFAVTGLIHPARVSTNAGLRPGDLLILTKPLGTGIISFAAQLGRAAAAALAAAARSMAQLNRAAAELMIAAGVRAATDITGFGLAGHLAEMAARSGMDVEIAGDELPLLEGVREALAAGIFPGAIERNRESCGEKIISSPGVTPEILDLCLDPQTSGGLLLAIAANQAEPLLTRLHAAGLDQARIIGQVRGPGPGNIYLHPTGKFIMDQNQKTSQTPPAASCCCAPAGQAAPATPVTAESCCCAPAAAAPPDAVEKNICCSAVSAPNPTAEACGCAPATSQNASSEKNSCCCSLSPADHAAEACCATPPADAAAQACCCAPAAADLAAPGKFADFLLEANRPGALDARTKEALALALSVLARCEPCVRVHLARARALGFTEAQIAEAAWLAIAFGGAPVMMFYQQIK